MTTETPSEDRYGDSGASPAGGPVTSLAATPDIAVRTEDVWKIYAQEPEDVEAVRGVSLEVLEGDFMTMAGPSGSGKTTLLNMLGGLTRPTRGRIWVRDVEITTLSNKDLARLRLESIGFVFQAFNLLPVLSALENAEFSLLLRGVPAEERHRRVRALFEEIGLEGLEDRKPGKLSGGQQQRVAVARASPRSSPRTSPRPTSIRTRAMRFWTSWSA